MNPDSKTSQKDQVQLALREAMLRDAVQFRRTAKLQNRLLGSRPDCSTQQFLTPATTRDDYFNEPYPVSLWGRR